MCPGHEYVRTTWHILPDICLDTLPATRLCSGAWRHLCLAAQHLPPACHICLPTARCIPVRGPYYIESPANTEVQHTGKTTPQHRTQASTGPSNLDLESQPLWLPILSRHILITFLCEHGHSIVGSGVLPTHVEKPTRACAPLQLTLFFTHATTAAE